MHKTLTIKATIPLPPDPFDAAGVIIALDPAIKALREALHPMKGAKVTHTFDARSSVAKNGPTPAPRAPRKAKAVPGNPNGKTWGDIRTVFIDPPAGDGYVKGGMVDAT